MGPEGLEYKTRQLASGGLLLTDLEHVTLDPGSHISLPAHKPSSVTRLVKKQITTFAVEKSNRSGSIVLMD